MLVLAPLIVTVLNGRVCTQQDARKPGAFQGLFGPQHTIDT